MSAIEFLNFQFTYGGQTVPALPEINLRVQAGEFLLVCGETGSGKTTLLRSIKPEIAPVGKINGEILIDTQPRDAVRSQNHSMAVGFVAQDPGNQTVMDGVRHELAFGLENLNTPPATIRRRMAEIVSFFGMEDWVERKVHTLSGGQKQLLNLAAVMIMQPDVLVLDEPTAQLDPVAAKSFLSLLKRVNDELGTTILLSEHRLEDTLSMANRIFFLDRGGARAHMPEQFVDWLRQSGHPFIRALPASTKIALRLGATNHYPLNVKTGRAWLRESGLGIQGKPAPSPPSKRDIVLEARDVWYRYGTKEDFVIRDARLPVQRGEIHAIVGGNGSGKTTLLHLLSGVYAPNRGKIKKASGLRTGLLPQDPNALFTRDTLYDELCEWRDFARYTEGDIETMIETLHLAPFRNRHPYDLSGGERQKAALAKLLLLSPDILLLDEPAKGLDAQALHELAGHFLRLRAQGKTIVLVTHNVEFAARTADRCSLLFHGGVACTEETRRFFTANHFYTTEANRVTRGLAEGCLLPEDVDYE